MDLVRSWLTVASRGPLQNGTAEQYLHKSLCGSQKHRAQITASCEGFPRVSQQHHPLLNCCREAVRRQQRVSKSEPALGCWTITTRITSNGTSLGTLKPTTTARASRCSTPASPTLISCEWRSLGTCARVLGA